MLTKTDLKEIDKLIKRRVREETEAEGKNTRDVLKSDILSSRVRIQHEIKDLTDRTKNLEIRLNNFEKDTKKEFQKLNKQFIDLFNFLDKDQIKTIERVKKIEKHLQLPSVS